MNASTATLTTTSTSTSTSPTTTTSATTVRPSLWKPGLLAGLVAAVATTTVVMVARAADVPVAVQGEQIPLAGFAQMTLVATVIGIVIARVLSTRARHPRRTFVMATVALTAVSLRGLSWLRPRRPARPGAAPGLRPRAGARARA